MKRIRYLVIAGTFLGVVACAPPPPPAQNLVPTTAAPAQEVTVISAFGYINSIYESPWTVFIESDAPCRLIGYEVNGVALPFESPFPSSQAQDCGGAGGGYYWASTRFALNDLVWLDTSGPWPVVVTDWIAITQGEVVVQLQDGSITRVPIPQTCRLSYGFMECRL